tara:strand:+ start:175 stop:525 length:351 start_codon:yes stop_codon:yes gene_type:complete
MFIRIRALAVTSFLAGILAFPQISLAKFTSADLLKWPEASQDSYFNTSIGMAGVIATQNRREAARCIDEWYFASQATAAKRNDDIRKILADNPSYHPQATILAIIRKACGRLAVQP